MNWKEKLQEYLRDSCGVSLSKEIVGDLQISDDDADMLMYAVDGQKSHEEIMEIIDWIVSGQNEDSIPNALREYIYDMAADGAVIGAFLKAFPSLTDEMKAYGLDENFNTRAHRNRWLSYIARDSGKSIDDLRMWGHQARSSWAKRLGLI